MPEQMVQIIRGSRNRLPIHSHFQQFVKFGTATLGNHNEVPRRETGQSAAFKLVNVAHDFLPKTHWRPSENLGCLSESTYLDSSAQRTDEQCVIEAAVKRGGTHQLPTAAGCNTVAAADILGSRAERQSSRSHDVFPSLALGAVARPTPRHVNWASNLKFGPTEGLPGLPDRFVLLIRSNQPRSLVDAQYPPPQHTAAEPHPAKPTRLHSILTLESNDNHNAFLHRMSSVYAVTQ